MVMMEIEKACGAEVTPRLSWTVTLKVNGLPAAVDGAPLMTPEEEFSVNPGGRLPLLTVQLLYGGVPPLAVSLGAE
jgi:hypothetical protein